MVWVLALEISLALIIGFVVLRRQSASLVGQRKIRSDATNRYSRPGCCWRLRTAHRGLSEVSDYVTFARSQ
jgi:hypothetical protein